MLTTCPECELPVSDKALSCPHCGYPLQTSVKPKQYRKSSKRRRLPNGFGQISEIKGRNLRNPFRAMITVGKTSTGRPICKPLKPESYFPTYNDAYAALVEYNRNPYELDKGITVKELYKRWSEERFQKIAAGTASTAKAAWKYCSSVYNMKVSDIRVRHIKGCMEEGTIVIGGEVRHPSATNKSRIKTLFNQLLDYAVEYELVDHNYSRSFRESDEIWKERHTVDQEHIPFTDSEMELLWKHVNDFPYVDVLLIQCYSGWRPKELGLIELDNVDLKGNAFRGGMKTDAGIDRIVPIHSRIQKLVTQKYNEAKKLGSNYLFNCSDPHNSKCIQLSYGRYRKKFLEIVKALNLDPQHRPHDGRKHFVTMAKKAKVDEYAIKYMVGHAISDVTEKVYTQRDYEWLKQEIEKIK